MLLSNEDVGHSALTGDVSKRALDITAVVDLVELDGIELGAGLGEELLRGAAVRAVRLAEDGDGVLVDDALDFGLGCGHGGWRGGAREEVTQERNGGGLEAEACSWMIL